MRTLSGFFPSNDYYLSRFGSEAIDVVKTIDVMAVWNYKNENEKNILAQYNQKAKLVDLSVLGDFVWIFEQPWTKYLKGKKVLVIHPFVKTITEQYKKRELLFQNPLVLPEFELKTLKAIQGLGESDEIKQYNNWFEALDGMCRQIDTIDFDIALIGAGAYGMFLGGYIKKSANKLSI